MQSVKSLPKIKHDIFCFNITSIQYQPVIRKSTGLHHTVSQSARDTEEHRSLSVCQSVSLSARDKTP